MVSWLRVQEPESAFWANSSAIPKFRFKLRHALLQRVGTLKRGTGKGLQGLDFLALGKVGIGHL